MNALFRESPILHIIIIIIILLFIYLFIYGRVGSSFLCGGFL